MADPRKAARKIPSIPAPSASVVVISPENEILLLHRVQTGTFSSAHVFPGGNLSDFHEGGLIPAIDSPARHVDGAAYRLAAIRETFEESGVLLASKRTEGTSSSSLLEVASDVSRDARVDVANNKVRFEDWLSSVGGIPDNENLIPFTRWLTPPNLARRYTTQMYIYMLPLAASTPGKASAGSFASADLTEVMAAEFASAATWVARAQRNEIILFPPQMYILSLLAPLLQGPAGLPPGITSSAEHYAAERARVAELVRDGRAPDEDAATFVPWADRVISPRMMGRYEDAANGGVSKTVMGLDHPGPELKGSGRAGDAYRVIVLSNLPPGPPRDIELRRRSDVMPLLRMANETKL